MVNRLQRTNILSCLSDGSAMLSQQLVGIHADLENVVQQGKDGRNRECCDEQGTESKLDDQFAVLLKHLWVVCRQDVVLSPLRRLDKVLLVLVLAHQLGFLGQLVLAVPVLLELRDRKLLELVQELFANKHNRQLNGQIYHTSAVCVCGTVILKFFAKDFPVYESLNVRDVEQCRVEVYEIEQESLQDQSVYVAKRKKTKKVVSIFVFYAERCTDFFSTPCYHTFILSKATMVLVVGQNFGETGVDLQATIRIRQISHMFSSTRSLVYQNRPRLTVPRSIMTTRLRSAVIAVETALVNRKTDSPSGPSFFELSSLLRGILAQMLNIIREPTETTTIPICEDTIK